MEVEKKVNYFYRSYGIPIHSEIMLPALLSIIEIAKADFVVVKEGKVPETLEQQEKVKKPLSIFNKSEFLFTMPNVARYYVKNGSEVIIEPFTDNWEEILVFFYSNCLAAILYQRGSIPFHVSGVLLNDNRVVLFAAPSRTGKSTLGTLLNEMGYRMFCDDTAVLFMEGGKCKALASYPMKRLWESTFKNQSLHKEEEKQMLRAELDKYGVYFHEDFISEAVDVAGVVFLYANSDHLQVSELKQNEAFINLGNNTYRGQWISGMDKGATNFQLLSSIAGFVPCFKAERPKDKDTFKEFTEMVKTQILDTLES